MNSALKNKYQICLVCCHDGKIFMYQSFFEEHIYLEQKTTDYCMVVSGFLMGIAEFENRY